MHEAVPVLKARTPLEVESAWIFYLVREEVQHAAGGEGLLARRVFSGRTGLVHILNVVLVVLSSGDLLCRGVMLHRAAVEPGCLGVDDSFVISAV